MEKVIILLFGMLIGCILSNIVSRVKSVGYLRIDTSDLDDTPYLFLELTKNIEFVYTKKYITLKINAENFITHK